MQEPIKHMDNEADVGSGEKGPAELETERMIEQIGEKNGLPDDSDKKAEPAHKADPAND
jgi:hypothetical protein